MSSEATGLKRAPAAASALAAALGPPAIVASDLGKCYRVFARRRDRLKQAIFRRRNYFQEFWALAGAGFEVPAGQTVGVIGRNGSGKSTLLQLVCGTLAPTTGRVQTRGRVAALLELGAGFHPEFTGRENVFLNARILGLSRRQTEERFERIAAFADIGGFIDQPVKTYSSGMFVRLAFSVAASVDADILVIDEALAVGDVFFRAKCMRYLREFKERGGTVLFVSHDASAVLALCDQAMWLDGGKLRQMGPARAVCDAYFAEESGVLNRQRAAVELPTVVEAREAQLAAETEPVAPLRRGVESFGEKGAEILGVDVRDVRGVLVAQFAAGQRLRLRIHVRAHRALARPIVGFYVTDRLGQNLFGENTTVVGDGGPMRAGEERVVSFAFDAPLLAAETYPVTVAVAEGTMISHTRHHWIPEACALTSAGGGTGATGLVGIPMQAVEFRAPAPAAEGRS